MAIAYQWAWRVMIIALEMVVPGLVGYWIDQQLGTVALFMVGGFIVGVTLGVWHLVKIASLSSSSGRRANKP